MRQRDDDVGACGKGGDLRARGGDRVRVADVIRDGAVNRQAEQSNPHLRTVFAGKRDDGVLLRTGERVTVRVEDVRSDPRELRLADARQELVFVQVELVVAEHRVVQSHARHQIDHLAPGERPAVHTGLREGRWAHEVAGEDGYGVSIPGFELP